MECKIITIDRELKIKLLQALKDGCIDLDIVPQLENNKHYVNIIQAPHTTLRVSRPLADNEQLNIDEYVSYLESRLQGENKAPASFIRTLSKEQMEYNSKYYKCLELMKATENNLPDNSIYTTSPDDHVAILEQMNDEKPKVIYNKLK